MAQKATINLAFLLSWTQSYIIPRTLVHVRTRKTEAHSPFLEVALTKMDACTCANGSKGNCGSRFLACLDLISSHSQDSDSGQSAKDRGPQPFSRPRSHEIARLDNENGSKGNYESGFSAYLNAVLSHSQGSDAPQCANDRSLKHCTRLDFPAT